MKSIFIILFLILSINIKATAQHRFLIEGRIDLCYTTYPEYPFDRIELILIPNLPNEKEDYLARVDEKGNFTFKKVPKGTYRIKSNASFFPDNDSTLIVNRDIKKLIYCADVAYRPAPIDSIERYESLARRDIKAGNAKIYEWTVWSLTSDPFKQLNHKIKNKYGYEYIMMTCVRDESREVILQTKLWESYNKIVYQHLNEQFGLNWRKKIKHERRKLRREKFHTT